MRKYPASTWSEATRFLHGLAAGIWLGGWLPGQAMSAGPRVCPRLSGDHDYLACKESVPVDRVEGPRQLVGWRTRPCYAGKTPSLNTSFNGYNNRRGSDAIHFL
jgi:hypothetical protein